MRTLFEMAFFDDVLEEGVKQARQRFLDTGKINLNDFNYLLSLDPSNNNKYIEKMIEWFIQGIDPSTLKHYIDKFDKFGSNLEIKDIMQYRMFDALQAEIDEYEKSKIAKQSDYDLTDFNEWYEDDNLLIGQPLSNVCTSNMAGDRSWCIARPNSEYWQQYLREGLLRQ